MMIERKSHIRKFLSAACAVMMVLLCGCSPKATDAKTVVTGTVNGLKYSWYEGIALFGPNYARGWYFHDEKILICDGMQGSGGHGLQVDSIGYDSSTDTVTITVVRLLHHTEKDFLKVFADWVYCIFYPVNS